MKVFELAKEMGTDSISLLDKLKSAGISVKSHMSTLTDEQISKARNALAPKTAAKKPVRKAVVRKKAGTASKVIKRKVVSGETTTTEITKKADGTVTKTPAVVVRKRRADAPTGEVSERLSAGSGEEFDQNSLPSEASHEAEYSPELEQDVVAPETEMAQEVVFEAQEETEDAPSPQAVAGKEQVETAPPREKKSFLKVVQATAKSALRTISRPDPKAKTAKPAPKTASSPDDAQDGDRRYKPAKITKLDKAGLARLVEEDAARKRGSGGGGAAGGAGTRERNVRPEDVRFRDYRKKEMVFLPKRKKIPVGKELKQTQITRAKDRKRVVEVDGTISVANLALQLNVRGIEVVRKLFSLGQQVTINDTLDLDTATLVATEYDFEIKNVSFQEEKFLEGLKKDSSDDAGKLKPRPAVVTIMGHVDHGKTSLLDAIRDSRVVEGEAGGITQHIGAYTVEKDGKKITFIDTPGHEAFTSMRARGAGVTDIVILVVAADDGVMPQTRESVSHAKAAKVPIIVAVNKMDKPGANPEKVKQALSELELLSEDWGGDTQFVPVSALKKTGLDDLLESINVQAEMLELKANPEPLPTGVVLEGKMEKGRGAVVSLLVQRGTIKKGSYTVAGTSVCRVKAIVDQYGNQVDEVQPGMAAEVLGFDSVPSAGEPFYGVEDESAAKKVVSNRMDKDRAARAASKKLSLEDLFAQAEAGDIKELKVIVKADVFGSVEAVRDSLTKLSNEKIKVTVILAAPGGITESDVLLASASNAIIVGFNVRPETKAMRSAENEGIEIKCYNIIYELLDDVKLAMAGRLEKKKVEKFLGRAEVRQTFTIPKIGMIAGSSVVDGKITRNANVRLLRESVVVYEGKMSSLKRFKDDAKEVTSGHECGIGLEDYNDIKTGDIIEAFDIELVQQQL